MLYSVEIDFENTIYCRDTATVLYFKDQLKAQQVCDKLNDYTDINDIIQSAHEMNFDLPDFITESDAVKSLDATVGFVETYDNEIKLPKLEVEKLKLQQEVNYFFR